ncbi:MAG: GIY-YIG nuclease family protein [Chitinophagaceae bacterium]|nr:GIY-YIG nuclease family protein [Chitinophagaceae bacterium]
MFYTYVLRSLKNGHLYKGSTVDLLNRLNEHNSGLVNYSKKFMPWELIYWEEYPTRTEAILRERFFKSGQGRQMLRTVLKEKQNIECNSLKEQFREGFSLPEADES